LEELGFQAFADAAHGVLVERGIDHAYRVGPGGHTWKVWAAEAPQWLAFIGTWLAAARSIERQPEIP
jgi:enterochelin esterase-like enzyme